MQGQTCCTTRARQLGTHTLQHQAPKPPGPPAGCRDALQRGRCCAGLLRLGRPHTLAGCMPLLLLLLPLLLPAGQQAGGKDLLC